MVVKATILKDILTYALKYQVGINREKGSIPPVAVRLCVLSQIINAWCAVV